ncbi:MAG: hypothetical protein QOK44_5946 [Betaproteobacteria bacterium]|jgi:hypothetical protein|nr:hypothetical protein [Betaproteobacteria bacterium]
MCRASPSRAAKISRLSSISIADTRHGVSLGFLIFALTAGHTVGSMAMLVMPATRSYAIGFASLSVPTAAALYLLAGMNPREAPAQALARARAIDAIPDADAPSPATHINRVP